ncbi:hypothetical protein TVAG_069980 [Trichomonas vaginalis G3]|uniref:Uncharacterized protein n=1 Tax=Trichomonas vaginalis (strain ATCC PRA-98 / G3) TaxID=412133 RepID=A2ESN9_TRIV3|nr:immunoglobulins domain-containing protein [Trichomonas vaginalis G3]EAY04348.1 hypothetical protein TVAG_069980 [Trichomonas vaginalis G3]KAI5551921.1 immunoglobulins domain-containing protein [Trichomonas vaginalis G3]|eukprot:XP_001316571.1 hypothetical protein [Trichomonas vaginalis G3]
MSAINQTLNTVFINRAVKECIGMNTFMDENHVCRCLPGFNFGDPVSKYGCYQCSLTCHKNGFCAHPGKCKCLKGLVGDGVLKCDIPIPTVTSVYPSIIRSQGFIDTQISYSLDVPYIPTEFWCKFHNTIVKGELIQNGLGKCKAPPSNEHAVRVSISFDTVKYSESDVFLFYNQEAKIQANFNWILIVLSIILFLWGNSIIMSWGKIDESLESPQDKLSMNEKTNNPFDKAKQVDEFNPF